MLVNDVTYTLGKNGDAKDIVRDDASAPPIGAVATDSVRIYIATDVNMTKPAIIQRSIETLLRAVKTEYAVSTGTMDAFIAPGAASSKVVFSVPVGFNYIELSIGANLANAHASGLVVETTNQIAEVILEDMKAN